MIWNVKERGEYKIHWEDTLILRLDKQMYKQKAIMSNQQEKGNSEGESPMHPTWNSQGIFLSLTVTATI